MPVRMCSTGRLAASRCREDEAKEEVPGVDEDDAGRGLEREREGEGEDLGGSLFCEEESIEAVDDDEEDDDDDEEEEEEEEEEETNVASGAGWGEDEDVDT